MAALIAARSRRYRFAGGETIQQRGDAANGFWLVEAGQVMVCRFGPEGDLTIYAVLGPGDLLGELAHFTGVLRQVDAVADSDAVLLRVEPATIDQLLSDEPDFARWLLKSLASQLRIALDRIEDDRSLSAEARVARALARFAAQDGPEIAITQQELADFVGVSRVTTGQALAALAAGGLVKRGYRQITVLDAGRLSSFAEYSA